MSDFFNALQCIVIRERLILYFEHQTAKQHDYSVRALNEAVTFSEANELLNSHYEEDSDGSNRYDSGLPVKNNTLENFLKRKSSSTKDESIKLICNYLLSEGFVSPRLVTKASKHPDRYIAPEFAGIAPSDPRLQKYRHGIEGEYFSIEDSEISHIWIAQPGRSKPFVTLRNLTVQKAQGAEKDTPSLKALNYDTEIPQNIYEGRIFLMPEETLMHVEICYSNRKWRGELHTLSMRGDELFLHKEGETDKIYERPSPKNCLTLQRNTYRAMQFAAVSDFVKTQSHGRGGFNIFGQNNSEEQLENTQTEISEEQLKLNTALIEAAKAGETAEVIKSLIVGANINYKDPEFGRTAAHWAASQNEMITVMALAGDIEEEDELLADVFQCNIPSQEDLEKWRTAKANRDPLIQDDQENCFASAFAPIGGDNSERNRTAKNIMMFLFPIEGRAMAEKPDAGASAVLNAWKPSSVMEQAHRDYPVQHPPGFGLPPVEPE